MHLSLILTAISLAWSARLLLAGTIAPRRTAESWAWRWQRALGVFLFSPLLLSVTALAVLCMGTQGQMWGLPVGWIGYLLAVGFLAMTVALVVWSVWQGWRSLQAISTYPTLTLHNTSARLLQTPALFAAQIGFWRSQLVLSQGLLDTLTPTQLEAVITHELAHVHYGDTFWFFWLGCVRRVTGWLPYSETIWQELLLLRELRADSWAAQRVEPLVLAESLLEVVKAPLTNLALHCAAFGAIAPAHRLTERIDVLLSGSEPILVQSEIPWRWLLVTLLPLLTLAFHS